MILVPFAFATDVDSYEPMPSAMEGTGGPQILSPGLGEHTDWFLGLQLVYAHNPLVRYSSDGTVDPIVSDSFATHLIGGYTLFGRVRIDADVPVYPFLGSDTSGGFNVGDIALGATVEVVDTDVVGLAIRPSLGLPTGNADGFAGAGGVSGGLVAAAGVTPGEVFFLDANVGAGFGPPSIVGDFELGSGLSAGAGAGLHLGDVVTIGAELDSFVTLAGGLGPYNKNPVELHGYGSFRSAGGFTGLIGLGTGIVAGIGAPDVRVIGGIGWHHPGKPPIKDTDKDGIPDPQDACIEVIEDADGHEDTDGCPDTDNDGDGFTDDQDACVNLAEDRDGFDDTDGCPETDNDQDGLVDGEDACPLQPGPESLEGCPDKDGDGFADRDDACPDIAGSPTGVGCPDRDSDRVPDMIDKCPDEPRDPREQLSRSDGCPKRVIVTAEKIEIKEKVFFDTNKATIKKESFGLLDDVAAVLTANPDIKRIEIAGHTDNVGDDAKNLKLSQGRADAVRTYLSGKGVAAERLTAVGYGETKALETNETETGRSNNRRVEFVILER